MSIQQAKKTVVGRVFAWAFVIIWAMVILGFSGQDGEESGELSRLVTQLLYRVFTGVPGDVASPAYRTVHLLVRKAAHMTEYAILGIALETAFVQYRIQPSIRNAAAGVGCFLFALLDEWKQTLVEGRSGRLTDVFIDTAGALLGILLFLLLLRVLARRKTEKVASSETV